jgi:glycosyltransferase involved in cell wall biosynthesis
MTENSNINPLVSVIMPVYNCAQYVDEAIESVVNQTYTNMEIFIIDDCSTDGTREMVESWAKLDNRIKPIYKSANSGYVDSLNMAIGLSNGEYIARMDGDDISLLARIDRQVMFMRENTDIDVLGTGYQILGTTKCLISQSDQNKLKIGLLFANQLAHPTILAKSEVLKNNLYDEAFLPAEDYELWVRLSAKYKLAVLPEILLKYRIHSNNSSKNVSISNLNMSIIRYQFSIMGCELEMDFLNVWSSFLKKNNKVNFITFNQIVETAQTFLKNNEESKMYNSAELNIFWFNFLYQVFSKMRIRHKLIFTLTKGSLFMWFFKNQQKYKSYGYDFYQFHTVEYDQQ